MAQLLYPFLQLHSDKSIWESYYGPSQTYLIDRRNYSQNFFTLSSYFIFRVEFWSVPTPIYMNANLDLKLLASDLRFHQCQTQVNSAGALLYITNGECVLRKSCFMQCSAGNKTYGGQASYSSVPSGSSNKNIVDQCTYIGNYGTGEATCAMRVKNGVCSPHGLNFSQNNCIQQTCYVLISLKDNPTFSYSNMNSNIGYNLRQFVHYNINFVMEYCSITNNSMIAPTDCLYIVYEGSVGTIQNTSFANNNVYSLFITSNNGYIYLKDVSMTNTYTTLLVISGDGDLYSSSVGTNSFSMYVVIDTVCNAVIPEAFPPTCLPKKFDLRNLLGLFFVS